MIFVSAVGAHFAKNAANELYPKLLPAVVPVSIPMGFVYDEFVHTREYQHQEIKKAGYIPDASPNEMWNYSFDGQYMWYALSSEFMKGGYVVRVPVANHPREAFPLLLQIYGGIEYESSFDTRSKIITFTPRLQVWRIAPAGLVVAVVLATVVWIGGLIVIGIYIRVTNGVRTALRNRKKWHTTIPT